MARTCFYNCGGVTHKGQQHLQSPTPIAFRSTLRLLAVLLFGSCMCISRAQPIRNDEFHPRYRMDPYDPSLYAGHVASHYNNNNNPYHRQPPRNHPTVSRTTADRTRRLQEDGGNAESTSTTTNNNDTRPVETYAAELRSHLLETYDRNSYPWHSAWQQSDSTKEDGDHRTGVEVRFSLNFHKVHKLNVAESTAHLVVWVRMQWNDPRLRWDPAEFGNLTKAYFWVQDGIGGGEVSEVWTPDIYLWNQEESMDKTLADAYAAASPNGDVYWSRPGLIKATCKFRGLGSFPFDRLGCELEFGSWAYSGLYIRPVKMGDGFSIGGSETAGQSFAEFSLVDVFVHEYVYPPFPAAPEEDWPVLIYEISCQRASKPYVRGHLLLSVMLNFCGFATLWIPPHVGERMGLAITTLLASVASELTVSEQLPNAEEVNWFVIFSLISMLFQVAIVFQSTVVIYFYYFTGSSLKPVYIKWMEDRWQTYRKGKKSPDETEIGRSTQHNNDAGNGSISDTNHTVRAGTKTKTNSNDSTNDDNKDNNKNTENDDKSIRIENVHVDHHHCDFEGSLRHLRLDAEGFKDEQAKINNLRWQRISRRVDDLSRLLFPTLYIIFLAVIIAEAGNT